MAKKILLADDSVTMRQVVAIALQGDDYELVAVESGSEAIALALAEPFDAVIVDASMPITDGYEVAAALKADCAAPVLLLHGANAPFDARRARDTGVDLDLEKPFASADLLGSVRELLATRPESNGPKFEMRSLASMISEPGDSGDLRSEELAGDGLAADAGGMVLEIDAEPGAEGSDWPPFVIDRSPALDMQSNSGGSDSAVNSAAEGTVDALTRDVGDGVAAAEAAEAPTDETVDDAVRDFIDPSPRMVQPPSRKMATGPAHQVVERALSEKVSVAPPVGLPPPPPGMSLPGRRSGRKTLKAPEAKSASAGPVPGSPPRAEDFGSMGEERRIFDRAPGGGERRPNTLVSRVHHGLVASLAATFAEVDPKVLDALVRLSAEVVERVVWEVVPELAEALIKEELERLDMKRDTP